MRPQLSHVDATQSSAENIDRPAGWVDVEAGQPAQRGLSRSILAQDDPAFIRLHLPADVVEDRSLTTDQMNIGEL